MTSPKMAGKITRNNTTFRGLFHISVVTHLEKNKNSVYDICMISNQGPDSI